MYAETISFLVAYGFLPKSWTQEAAKTTVKAAPSSTFAHFSEKINEFIENVYIMPPHIAFLGLYSAAVMTWFILTGMSDGMSEEVRKEKKAITQGKSVAHKEDPNQNHISKPKPVLTVKKEVKHDRGDQVMNKLQKVFKETPTLQAEIIDVPFINTEKVAPKTMKHAEMKEAGEILSVKPARVQSNENKSLVKDMDDDIPSEPVLKDATSKEIKGAYNKAQQSGLKSERSIINLKTIQRSLLRKKDTTEQFLRLLSEIQSDEVLSDTDKEFENERIQKKVDLTKPSKPEIEKTKVVEKKTDKIKRQLASSGLYTKFLSVPEVQRKLGENLADLKDMNGKTPLVILKRHPRNAVSAHRPFRMASAARHNTELRTVPKRRLDRESPEARSSSAKGKRSF